MNLQLATVLTTTLAIAALVNPVVRGAVFSNIPNVEFNNDCGKIVCGGERPASRSAPDIRFNP